MCKSRCVGECATDARPSLDVRVSMVRDSQSKRMWREIGLSLLQLLYEVNVSMILDGTKSPTKEELDGKGTKVGRTIFCCEGRAIFAFQRTYPSSVRDPVEVPLRVTCRKEYLSSSPIRQAIGFRRGSGILVSNLKGRELDRNSMGHENMNELIHCDCKKRR